MVNSTLSSMWTLRSSLLVLISIYCLLLTDWKSSSDQYYCCCCCCCSNSDSCFNCYYHWCCSLNTIGWRLSLVGSWILSMTNRSLMENGDYSRDSDDLDCCCSCCLCCCCWLYSKLNGFMLKQSLSLLCCYCYSKCGRILFINTKKSGALILGFEDSFHRVVKRRGV